MHSALGPPSSERRLGCVCFGCWLGSVLPPLSQWRASLISDLSISAISRREGSFWFCVLFVCLFLFCCLLRLFSSSFATRAMRVLGILLQSPNFEGPAHYDRTRLVPVLDRPVEIGCSNSALMIWQRFLLGYPLLRLLFRGLLWGFVSRSPPLALESPRAENAVWEFAKSGVECCVCGVEACECGLHERINGPCGKKTKKKSMPHLDTCLSLLSTHTGFWRTSTKI